MLRPQHPPQADVASLLTRIGTLSDLPALARPPGGLGKLNLLLEATSLLHSNFRSMQCSAPCLITPSTSRTPIAGCSLSRDPAGALRVNLARGSKGDSLPPER